LNEEDYKKLKGLLWAFRKNPENLEENGKEILEIAFNHSPDLKKAYELRNIMTDNFNKDCSKKEAIVNFQEWEQKVRESGLKCFDSFVKTLDNFKSEIANYFNKRCNSGFVEGLNNKIKVIKRRCYGIFNIKHLKHRIVLDTLGAELLIIR